MLVVYRRDTIPLPNTPHGVQGKRNTLAMTYKVVSRKKARPTGIGLSRGAFGGVARAFRQGLDLYYYYLHTERKGKEAHYT